MQKDLRDRLDRDLSEKGQVSSYAFMAFSLFLIIDRFGTQTYAQLFLYLGIAIFSLNFCRKVFSHMALSTFPIRPSFVHGLNAVVILNAVLWSVVFCLSMYEHKIQGNDNTLSMFIMVGFAASSMVTLSYSSFLWLIFQGLMTLPPAVIAVYFGRQGLDHGYPLATALIIYFVYLFGQSKAFRREVIVGINSSLKLEQTNRELFESRREIIEQTAKVQHASRMASLGEMSGGIAHEINNPLAIILGNIEVMQKQAAQGELSVEQMEKKIKRISDASHRISKIVRGLRQFSKQSDREPMVVTSIKSLVDETLDFSSEKFRSSGIAISCELEQDCQCKCRPVQISQVLINLLNNAYDCLENFKGDKWIKIQITNTANLIHIDVSNSGPLIPKDIHEKLFMPFFTTKDVGKGTGLGLSISQGIVSEHGGEIYLDEQQPHTNFTIVLPRDLSQEIQKAA